MSLSIVILAAGKGSRMKSTRPKVIHRLAGKSMLQHVVDTSLQLGPQQILVVIGHESQQVTEEMQGQDVTFVSQTEQLGTGHAVMQCKDKLQNGNDVLVLYGDVPLIRDTTLKQLIDQGQEENVVCLLSFIARNPTGYGRIVRNDGGHVSAIVEEKDASDDIRNIKESNSGIIYIKGSALGNLLSELDNDNAQQEYYLTDVVKHAVAKGQSVNAVICQNEQELMGVNNQQQLAQMEEIYRKERAEELMQQGVKLYDPERIDIRGTLVVGEDVEIDINCILEGDIQLGNGVKVGANCVLKDCRIGDGTIVLPMSMIEKSEIGTHNNIGPYARIRPDTLTAENAKIGNFVEIKKSVIGKGSKVNHLTYVGDTEMGSDVNIGAGTITCNYDGAFKHKTTIEDGVFVGSGTQLVAPVRLKKGTTIGAGSTITRDTEENRLTFSRAKQVSISGWKRPAKTEKR
jgi:bifunctional UDP-N-acetylglucosamine pyrophosphorylase/glucosamine-1-phosphate N-acetyltransferase